MIIRFLKLTNLRGQIYLSNTQLPKKTLFIFK
jgi:hypothetical protein